MVNIREWRNIPKLSKKKCNYRSRILDYITGNFFKNRLLIFCVKKIRIISSMKSNYFFCLNQNEEKNMPLKLIFRFFYICMNIIRERFPLFVFVGPSLQPLSWSIKDTPVNWFIERLWLLIKFGIFLTVEHSKLHCPKLLKHIYKFRCTRYRPVAIPWQNVLKRYYL